MEPPKKKRLGVQDRLYPMPVPLVVGAAGDEVDLLPVAWISISGAKPASVAMALRKTRRTLELIRETGEFTVNLPSAGLAREVDHCGLHSGRDSDKLAATRLTTQPSALVTPPIIVECPYNLECRVLTEVDNGQYVVVVGEIVETHADEDILDETGEKVDVELLDPLVYIAGTREYRRLGEKIADAFSVGHDIPARER